MEVAVWRPRQAPSFAGETPFTAQSRSLPIALRGRRRSVPCVTPYAQKGTPVMEQFATNNVPKEKNGGTMVSIAASPSTGEALATGASRIAMRNTEYSARRLGRCGTLLAKKVSIWLP